MLKLNKIIFLLLVSIVAFSLHASATTPTYSVSVGGGSYRPNPICSGLTATASLTGSLNVQNPNQEIQESGDSWGWTASVTGYASTSQAAFIAIPSGVTPPIVGASSGGATSSVTATAYQTTSPGYYQVTLKATDNFTLTDSSTSPATVTSQAQSATTTLEITVVTVSDIQYNDPVNGWISIPANFVAMEGTTSQVRAIPMPSDASFPSGQPKWSGIASGTGTVATATFSTDSITIEDETITATLGGTAGQTANLAHSVSANANSSASLLIVKKATTFKLTPKLLPAVTFPNRSVTSFGVGETVSLDFDVKPIGTPMPETVWSLSGTGQLLDNGAVGEIGDYWAGVSAGSTTFTLSITSGASKGKSVNSSSVSILVPNPAIEVRDPRPGDYHVNQIDKAGYQGDASAGFLGIISLLPKSVSFRGTQFGEKNCFASTGTGDLASATTQLHMPDMLNGSVLYNDIAIDPTYGNAPVFPAGSKDGKGNNIQGKLAEDGVRMDIGPNDRTGKWVAGDALYNIPWLYHVRNLDGTITADQQILIMAMTMHIGADGSATITKSQGTSSRNLLDPDNEF